MDELSTALLVCQVTLGSGEFLNLSCGWLGQWPGRARRDAVIIQRVKSCVMQHQPAGHGPRAHLRAGAGKFLLELADP